LVAEGTVLLRVSHAGVGFVDYLQTFGGYQDRYETPFILGMEVAGTVVEALGINEFAPGDVVMGFTRKGGFAELVALDPLLTFRIPDGISTVEGAAMVLNYQTAAFALDRRARVQHGEHVVVHGAGGGVGTAAVQIAKVLGASVTGVVSSSEKATAALRAGADDVITLANDSWLDALRRTHPGGVEVIIDPVGGDRFDDSLRALAPEGRVVTLGFTGGEIPAIKANRLLFRNISVIGAAWGERLKTDAMLAQALHRRITEWAAKDLLHPIIGGVFPLADAAAAIREIGDRRSSGKIVLEVAN
jgi:NADPH2:quinone reductase